MTSGPITSFQQKGGNGSSNIFSFLGFQNHCRLTAAMELEQKLWQINTEYYKSKDVTLPTKVHIIKAVALPVVMYKCESWTKRRLSTEKFMFSDCGSGKDS